MIPLHHRLAVVLATITMLGACSSAGSSSSSDGPTVDGAVVNADADGGPDDEVGIAAPDTLAVTETGFTTYEDFDGTVGIAGATVLNRGPKHLHLVSVTFTFRDADGNEIGRDSHQITTVSSGRSVPAGVQDVPLDGEPASVDTELRLVGEGVDWGMPYGMDLHDLTITPHEWSDGTIIEGSTGNALDQPLENLEVSCLLRSGGDIVGAGFSVIEPLEPNESFDWSVLAPIAVDEAECIATQLI